MTTTFEISDRLLREAKRLTAERRATLSSVVEGGRIIGAQVHDARIAALCAQYGVKGLRTRNPLPGG